LFFLKKHNHKKQSLFIFIEVLKNVKKKRTFL